MASKARDDDAVPRKLRIGIILSYPYCPRWQLTLLEKLFELSDSSVSVYGLEDNKASKTYRSDLYHHWQTLDANVFPIDPDEALQRSQDELLHDLSAGEPACQKVSRNAEQLVDMSGDQSIDVILWLLPRSPPRKLSENVSAGVWSLSSVKNEAVGFWELIESVPMVTCELFTSESNPARQRTIGRAFAQTDHLSLTKTLRSVRAIDESLLLSRLNEIRRRGAIVSRLPSADKRSPENRGRPGIFRLLSKLSVLYGRYLIEVATRRFHRDQWQLAYRVGGDRLSREGLTVLAPDNEDFWADPFVVKRDGRTVILFEEFEARTRKGRIAAIEIDSDGGVAPMSIVLDCEHHLSYPFTFEHDGSLYMIPESADSGRVEAFRCVEFPGRWEPHAVLLDNIRAFDATLVQHGDKWWLFAAVQHNGNTTCDELHLFHAPDPFGEWTPHPANPVSLDIRCARPAGAMYQIEGQLFRPAQDCSERYGYALSIQRVIRLDVEEYEEETVQQNLPDWKENSLGTHTINRDADVSVYDCYVRRRK